MLFKEGMCLYTCTEYAKTCNMYITHDKSTYMYILYDNFVFLHVYLHCCMCIKINYIITEAETPLKIWAG